MPKIADLPVEPPPDTAKPADTPTPATTDTPAPDAPVTPPAPEAAPAAAAPTTSPETPTPDAPQLAPTSSKRPQSRTKPSDKPADTAAQNQAAADKAAADKAAADKAAADKAAADRAAQKSAAQAASDKAAADKAAAQKAAQKATSDAAAKQAAIDAAVAGANGGDGSNDGPKGPPMTGGEIDGLRVAIKNCWNLGTLSSAAMQVKVTVRVDVGQDRKPQTASIRMTGFEGGAEATANQVFEAARRAIIRCSKDGLPLPPDKYDTWKDLELVFDPSGMRLR